MKAKVMKQNEADSQEGLVEQLEALKDEVVEKVEEARDRVVEVKDVAVQRSRDLVDQTRTFITEHPIASVGIAVAAGYVAGRIMRL